MTTVQVAPMEVGRCDCILIISIILMIRICGQVEDKYAPEINEQSEDKEPTDKAAEFSDIAAAVTAIDEKATDVGDRINS